VAIVSILSALCALAEIFSGDAKICLTLEPIQEFIIRFVRNRKDAKAFLRSGEMARLAGVSADTLRHYERKGLISAPRRSSNGYRQYPAEMLERIQLIRRALSVGFTLDELAAIFKTRHRGGVPCRDVRKLAELKLSEIEAQLSEITRLRDQWILLLKDWDDRLAKAQAGEPVHLLETLNFNYDSAGQRSSLLAPRTLNKKRR
jgi:DNA-binding transcriptional MerR regulator